MSHDDYLAARMIAPPLCLFDCDVPADGATAVIVSRADATAGLRRRPIDVDAVGTAIRGRPSWDQWDVLTTMALRDSGAILCDRDVLRPTDVGCVELYDGLSFRILVLCAAPGVSWYYDGSL